MSVQGKAWKIGAAVAALVCTGAIAATVGVTIHRYHYEGQGRDGSYEFMTEPEIIYQATSRDANGAQSGFATGGAGGVTTPSQGRTVEQAQKDLEETDRLRHQNLRKLISVSDLVVNGRFCHQSAIYEYTLPDGRTRTVGEDGPEAKGVRDPAQIAKDHEEIGRLRQQGRRELVHVDDVLIRGGLQRACSFRYVLADGREMTIGEGDPELPVPAKGPTVAEIHEVWRLHRLQQGTFLGYEDRMVHGRLFTFETEVYTFTDGTVVTHAQGDPKGGKTILSTRDWDELRSLKGEDLGTEERTVDGRVFSFRKLRYILHDGSEVIQSIGIPKENP